MIRFTLLEDLRVLSVIKWMEKTMRKHNIANKIIAIILSVAMTLIVLPYSAYSADLRNNDNYRITQYISKDESARAVSLSSDEKTASIVIDSVNGLVEVVIRYTSDSDKVYRWVFTNDSVFDSNSFTNTNYTALIDYAETNIILASVIELGTLENYDAVHQSPVRGGDPYLLMQDLVTLVGSNSYNGVLRYTDSRGGINFHVYETLGLYVTQLPNVSWGSALTLGSIILTVLGRPIESEILNKLGIILDVAAAVTSIVPAGGLKEYNCVALVNADGSSYLFTYTDKQITYTGYSNAYNASRPYIINSTHQTVYSDGVVYFYSYPSQIDTAYSVYLQVGL